MLCRAISRDSAQQGVYKTKCVRPPSACPIRIDEFLGTRPLRTVEQCHRCGRSRDIQILRGRFRQRIQNKTSTAIFAQDKVSSQYNTISDSRKYLLAEKPDRAFAACRRVRLTRSGDNSEFVQPRARSFMPSCNRPEEVTSSPHCARLPRSRPYSPTVR